MAKVSFDYSALVNNFSGEVKKIEPGARAMTESEIWKKSTGWEPDVKTGVNFEALLQGEDGMEFAVKLVAKNRDAAFSKLEEDYPESSIIAVDFEGARDFNFYCQAMKD